MLWADAAVDALRRLVDSREQLVAIDSSQGHGGELESRVVHVARLLRWPAGARSRKSHGRERDVAGQKAKRESGRKSSGVTSKAKKNSKNARPVSATEASMDGASLTEIAGGWRVGGVHIPNPIKGVGNRLGLRTPGGRGGGGAPAAASPTSSSSAASSDSSLVPPRPIKDTGYTNQSFPMPNDEDKPVGAGGPRYHSPGLSRLR